MRVVIKEVGKAGEIREIEDDLKVYQDIVGGDIETFRLTHDILVVLNEDGWNQGLTPNFKIPCHDNQVETIVGDVAFVSIEGCDFAGLKDEHLEFLKRIGILNSKYKIEYIGYVGEKDEPYLRHEFEVDARDNVYALLKGEKVISERYENLEIIDARMFVDPSVKSRDLVFVNEEGTEIAGTLTIKERI